MSFHTAIGSISLNPGRSKPFSKRGSKDNLGVELGNRVEAVSFYVFERLSTQVLLGCDFCAKHFEAIPAR